MGAIRLRTAVPGPRSQELHRRREQAVPRGLSHATPIYVARAEGALLEDVDGNVLIDFAGGIGCLNVGHRNSSVTSAIHRQVDRFLHTCAQVTPYEDYIALAEAMNRLTPGDFAKKTLFLNSGVEAVENAVKIARAHTKRPAIVCFEDAFHGRTLLGMALTSKTHPYKAGFEPFPWRNLSHPVRLLLSLLLWQGVSQLQDALRVAGLRRVFPPPRRLGNCCGHHCGTGLG